MGMPNRLRIPLDEYRFPCVGRCSDGTQFLAYVTGAFPGRQFPDLAAEWRSSKRWIGVVHLFDAEGNHVRSEQALGGLDIEGRQVVGERAYAELDRMLQPLGLKSPELCDIWVRMFEVEIDGIVHGLFYERDEELEAEGLEEDCDHVMLWPRDIMFHPPWDSGEYST